MQPSGGSSLLRRDVRAGGRPSYIIAPTLPRTATWALCRSFKRLSSSHVNFLGDEFVIGLAILSRAQPLLVIITRFAMAYSHLLRDCRRR